MNPTCSHEPFTIALRSALDHAGLTVTAAAALAGVSKPQLHRWLNGDNKPSFDAVRDLGRALERDHPLANVTAAGLLAAAGYGTPIVLARDPVVERVDALNLNKGDRGMLHRLCSSSEPQLAVFGFRLLRFLETGPGEKRRRRWLTHAQAELREAEERMRRAAELLDLDADTDDNTDIADTV